MRKLLAGRWIGWHELDNGPTHATWNLLSTEDAFGGFGCFIDDAFGISDRFP